MASGTGGARMEILTLSLLMLIPVLVALAWYLPAVAVRRAVARPFPAEFAAILRRNLAPYQTMPPPLQQQLKRLILQFLAQKKFIGCGGLKINDEMRVTVAAQACLLILNQSAYQRSLRSRSWLPWLPQVFPALGLILLYPSSFVVPRDQIGVGGLVTHASQTLAGESWNDGRVILAWDHVQQSINSFASGHNVVIHEFAHQLDSETGSSNGAPALPSRAAYQRWSQVLGEEFERLQEIQQAQQQQQQLQQLQQQMEPDDAPAHDGDAGARAPTANAIDFYGATNPAEFFAVVSETFFCQPHSLAQHHPRLFDEFLRYYRVDPRMWL
jgi:MtfA peptidase